jgi:protein-L-isoaspartate(D-aspartate) O-methyltransferase
MMDFAAARTHMVESQVRTSGVTDHRVLAAFRKVPREDFAPVERRDIAYVDDDLLISSNGARPPRYLMEPMVLARLIELAEIRPTDRVLHLGCATGYGTAILGVLAREVLAIDENAELATLAGIALEAHGIANARVLQAPHAEGVPASAPFDVVLIEGQIPLVPSSLLAQLADGGRLVAVVGDRPIAAATLHTRHGDAISIRPAFEAAARPLAGFEVERPAFVF